jgi:hypothetical protein
LPIAARGAALGLTVCALPNSDFEMIAGHAAGQARLDRGPQSRTAGADHDHVVLVSFMCLMSGPQLMIRRSEIHPCRDGLDVEVGQHRVNRDTIANMACRVFNLHECPEPYRIAVQESA